MTPGSLLDTYSVNLVKFLQAMDGFITNIFVIIVPVQSLH